MEKNKFRQLVFERKKFPLGEILLWILLIFLCYVVFVFYSFADYFEAVNVDGDSMIPTYNKNGGNDIVYTHKSDYNYGDIITINVGTKTIIKRVVGLEGDQIAIKKVDGEYRVFRNGGILEENYIKDISGNLSTYQNFHNIFKEDYPEKFDENGVMTVGENEIFVLGDNRGGSRDSSYYGNFDLSQVTGKVFYSVPADHNPTLSIFFQLFFPIFYI